MIAIFRNIVVLLGGVATVSYRAQSGTTVTDLDQRRQWMEALHEYSNDQERLFGLVASLANLLDKDLVVETMQSVLGVEPVHDGDCVIFDDLAIQFGKDDRIKSVFTCSEQSMDRESTRYKACGRVAGRERIPRCRH
jgi:hypothetical protein